MVSAGVWDSAMVVRNGYRKHGGGFDKFAAQGKAGSFHVSCHFGGGKLADQFALLVAQAFLFQAGANAGLEQHRVTGLVR